MDSYAPKLGRALGFADYCDDLPEINDPSAVTDSVAELLAEFECAFELVWKENALPLPSHLSGEFDLGAIQTPITPRALQELNYFLRSRAAISLIPAKYRLESWRPESDPKWKRFRELGLDFVNEPTERAHLCQIVFECDFTDPDVRRFTADLIAARFVTSPSTFHLLFRSPSRATAADLVRQLERRPKPKGSWPRSLFEGPNAKEQAAWNKKRRKLRKSFTKNE